MATVFTRQGLAWLMKNGLTSKPLYLGLVISGTPSTCPSNTATGGASPNGWQEMQAAEGRYERVMIPPEAWSELVTEGSGQKMTAPERVFTGFVGTGVANGYVLATSPASDRDDVAVCFANFTPAAGRAFATEADSLALTASIRID